MVETEELSRLIGDIYDATLDRGLWVPVLQKFCAFIGGVSAVIFSVDATRAGRFYFGWNDNPSYTVAYFETYARINPLTPHLMMTEPGDCYIASRLMPYEELQRSQFFREWCVPQGYADLVGTTLERSSTASAFLTTGHSIEQGLMDDEALRRMRLLSPHFRRAVLISRVIEMDKVEADTMAVTLDGVAAAVFLVDRQGTVVYANRRGEAALAAGDVVVAQGGSLGFADGEANRALREAIAAAAAGDEGLANRAVAVPLLSPAGAPFVAHLMPLTSGARAAAGAAFAAAAAVFVREASLDLPLPIEAVALQYRLTPSEIRVLYAVVEAGGVAAIARVLGIGEATVKTHLRRLFDKTGTGNQADLVRLVAAYASPLG